MATTADITKGMCIELDGDIVKIIDFQKFQVGRGSGKIWTKIKSTTSGKIKEHTFNTGTTLVDVRIERRPFQFLYGDDESMEMMNPESFEQISISRDMVENGDLLKEGETLDVLIHAGNEKILSCEMPTTVILQITYTEPGIKGDTATNSLKLATVETGAEVRVPLFCETGDVIKINVAERSYSERVRK